MKSINPNFIAAFGQSNEGDASSNSAGCCCDWQYNNGQFTCPNEQCTQIGSHCYRCTGQYGDCGGKPGKCTGRGPGVCPLNDLDDCRQDYMSAMKTGKDQFDYALKLWNSNMTELTGDIQWAHNQANLTNKEIDPDFLPCTGDHEKWCNYNLNVFYDKEKKQL